MRARIRKWGNSLALRIPRSLAADARLVTDTDVDLTVEDGRLIVTPVASGPSLDDLLARVTPENAHAEVETGHRVGHEAW